MIYIVPVDSLSSTGRATWPKEPILLVKSTHFFRFNVGLTSSGVLKNFQTWLKCSFSVCKIYYNVL